MLQAQRTEHQFLHDLRQRLARRLSDDGPEDVRRDRVGPAGPRRVASGADAMRRTFSWSVIESGPSPSETPACA